MAIIDGKIRCSKCKKSKTLDAFSASIRTKGCGQCRPCKLLIKKEMKEKNPEKLKLQNRLLKRKKYLNNPKKFLEYNRTWRKENKHLVRQANLKKAYGLDLLTYKKILGKQNNACGICGVKNNSNLKSLFVDHCHATGKIRGILCQKCNTGLGFLGDNIQSIKNVLTYLERGSK